MLSSTSDDWEITPRGGGAAKTVVLVGKTGNGKSATGNTIIGRKVFDSMFSLGGVTSSCQLETTILDGGQTLNVIDTPGLFDSQVEPHEMAKEIAKCIDLAKDGIHAIVLVLALGVRFSEEEAYAFESLCEIFGDKISDYMIVVFSRGDVLPENKCLDDVLGDNCPEILKIWRQRKDLLYLIDDVVEKNGGTHNILMICSKNSREQMNQIVPTSDEGKSELLHSNDQQFERFIEMVESRMKERVENLEKQLAEERAARAETEVKVLQAQSNSKDEVVEMRERLMRAEEKSRELENKLNNHQFCAIM